MADRNYYVICDDNCKFEGMTKEQILAAIAEVTGATPTQIDDAFITKIKEQNRNSPLKFWVGTNAQYNELTPVDGVFYIITDADPLIDVIKEVEQNAQDIGEMANDLLDLRTNGTDELNVDDDAWMVQKFANGLVQAWTTRTKTIASGESDSQPFAYPSGVDPNFPVHGFVQAMDDTVDAPACFYMQKSNGVAKWGLGRKNTTDIGYYNVFLVGRWK